MGAGSLFQRVMAESFATLPPLLQSVHDARPSKVLRGRASVQRGAHWLAILLARIVPLPPSSANAPVIVKISADPGGETWTRNFDDHTMRSRLWADGDLLVERLGPVTLSFRLSANGSRIDWQVAGATCLGIPLPVSWFAGASATEQLVDGRYTFDARAVLPIVGLLIHYRGWLAE